MEKNEEESNIVGNTDVPVSENSEEQEESLKIAESDNLNAERDQKTSTSKEAEKYESKRKNRGVTKKPTIKLSTRTEYLSRPKKDALDSLIDARLDGSLPENALPAWHILPLPTKIPFAQCPIQVTSRKLGTNLFLPPPANDFDLEDENNLLLPYEKYDKLHDPNMIDYFKNRYVSKNLTKGGFITESERVTCTLKEINKYRTYQRRILAAEVQKNFRDQDEEFREKRAEGMKERITRDMQRYHERRTQGAMRRWIKNTVASIKESSMKNQMIRDMKVLNSQIRRQRAQTERVEAVEERYQRLYAKHIKKKSDVDKRKQESDLNLAEEDVIRLEKLCEKKEKEKFQRKEKMEEFWKRKSEWQVEWVQRGKELDEIRDLEKQKNIEILCESGRLPKIFYKQEQEETQQRIPEGTDIKRENGADEEGSVIKPENLEEPLTNKTIQSATEEIVSEQSEEEDAPREDYGSEPLVNSSQLEEDIPRNIK